MQAQAGHRSDEEDMDVEQIDIRALERVSPRTTLMAPEQVRQAVSLPCSCRSLSCWEMTLKHLLAIYLAFLSQAPASEVTCWQLCYFSASIIFCRLTRSQQSLPILEAHAMLS